MAVTPAVDRTTGPGPQGRSRGRELLRNNSLSIVCFALFLVFTFGLAVSGHQEFNEEQVAHDQPAVGFGDYLVGNHFWQALSENWESEFLQMGAYVLLTVFLVQKGSAESKDPDEHEAVDDDPGTDQGGGRAPWPVRRGGLRLKLYENSLLLAFGVLFLASFVLHAVSGAHEFSADQQAHSEPGVSMLEYVRTSRFWFESFQNWQSEFLAVFAIVVLTVFLRQRGSPESKPVTARNSATNI